MFTTINGKQYRLIPGTMTRGVFCANCKQKNAPGVMVQTPAGFAHATCVKNGTGRLR